MDASEMICSWVVAAVLSVTGVSALHAQDTRESAAADEVALVIHSKGSPERRAVNVALIFA